MAKVKIYDNFLDNIQEDPEMITEEFLETLQIITYNRMKEKKMSNNDLADSMQRTKGRISQILNETKDIKLSTYVKILYHMNLKPIPYCIDMETNEIYELIKDLYDSEVVCMSNIANTVIPQEENDKQLIQEKNQYSKIKENNEKIIPFATTDTICPTNTSIFQGVASWI